MCTYTHNNGHNSISPASLVHQWMYAQLSNWVTNYINNGSCISKEPTCFVGHVAQHCDHGSVWNTYRPPSPVVGPSLTAVQGCLVIAHALGSLGLAATQGRKRRSWGPRTVVPSSLPGKWKTDRLVKEIFIGKTNKICQISKEIYTEVGSTLVLQKRSSWVNFFDVCHMFEPPPVGESLGVAPLSPWSTNLEHLFVSNRKGPSPPNPVP